MPCIFCYFWQFKRQLVAFTGFGIKVTARIIPALSLGPAFQPLRARLPQVRKVWWVLGGGPEPTAGWSRATAHNLAHRLGCGTLRVCQHLCQSFPGEKGERRLRSADKLAGCFRDALRAVSLRGAAGRAGTPRRATARSPLGTASPPGMRPSGHAGLSHLNLTSSHQSFWQEEQIILGESCFWRLLNCSWHCSESFNSLENPKHFNIARILAHRMTGPTAKRDPAHRGDAPPLPF